MSKAPPSTRRDPRIELRPGTASVEFEFEGSNGYCRRGDVVMVSATGLAFTLDADPGIEAGTILVSASVRIGRTLLEGDLSVRYSRPTGNTRIEFGCLFYPASPEGSASWMTIVERRSSVPGSMPPHLPIRCSNCQQTIWLSSDKRPGRQCFTCDQEYNLGERLRERQLADLHQRARGLAKELGIDLPSAASMLLGILTLSEVRDVLGCAPATEPSAPRSGAGRARGIDPAFTPALEAGTLSRAQAVQRGNREAYAKGLVARHRISLEDAYAVADNRRSLLSVIRERRPGQPITTRPDHPASSLGLPTAIALFLLLAFLVASHQLDDSTEGAAIAPDLPATTTGVARLGGVSEFNPSRPTPAPAAEVHSDPDGNPIRVVASRPEAVLSAYCEKVGGRPVGLAAGVIPEPDLWLGIHDDDTAFDYRRAIAIRKDRTTGRWTTGDGTSPIQGFPVGFAQMGETHDPMLADPSRLPGDRMAR